MKIDTRLPDAPDGDKGASHTETGVQTGTDNGRRVERKDNPDLFDEHGDGESTDADQRKPEDETQNPLEVGFR